MQEIKKSSRAIATIREVANVAGVHQSTVSRAFNGAKGVSPEVRDKIREIADKLNYRPNRLAQMVSRQKTDTIGFLCMGRGRHYEQVGRLLQAEAAKAGYTLEFVFIEPMDEKKEKQGFDKLLGQRVDGLVMHISGAGVKPSHIKMLRQQGMSVVMYEPPTEEYGRYCDTLTVDWARGTKMLVDHLVELGCRNFAFVVGDSRFIPDKKRIDGYCLALAQAGIDFDSQLRIKINMDFFKPINSHHRYGYTGALELIKSGRSLDAFVCHNDEYAIGAMSAFYDAGVKVPEGIRVTGFDNIPESAYWPVPLTTIRQPVDEIGQMLVSLLVSRMNKKLDINPINYMVQPELVVRGSTNGVVPKSLAQRDSAV